MTQQERPTQKPAFFADGDSDDFLFASIKEDRGWYFAEYSPPLPNHRFSQLHLVVLETRALAAVAVAMESEADAWLTRYPVPIMATAFSMDGSVLSLEAVRANSHLIAWLVPPETKPVHRWTLVADEDLPDIALNRNFLKDLFVDVPLRKGRMTQEEVAKFVVAQKVGWWIVFVWAVVVPLGVALLEWWSDLLGMVVLGYAFFKAVTGALRLTGRLPKSQRQRDVEADELKMRHHHYHCERNPVAFNRLKAENFERWEIERTKAEAAAIKTGGRVPPGAG